MNNESKWSELLQAAVTQPGLILKAYTNFHGYSISNQIAAMVQCNLRSIPPGPINTYQKWRNLGRQVRKGEKALWMCIPLVRYQHNDRQDKDEFIAGFIWRPNWFVLSQTDGEPVEMPNIQDWDKALALSTLGITETEFQLMNGNTMGYATGREIRVSPLSPLPHKTLFHEMAHVELLHTLESSFNDSEQTPRNLREVEAESVALILCESLELPGADYCRGYIQNWLEGDVIPEKSAQRIFGAADRILKAGKEVKK
jgi:antirestriction protein ArdC